MSAKPPRVSPRKQPPPAADFWQNKGLEELAAEQGVRPVKRLEEVLGRGADLWADDAELDAFLQALRERRRRGGYGQDDEENPSPLAEQKIDN